MDFSQPRVMAVLNATPDSFFAASRSESAEAVRSRAEALMAAGADILDVGAQSTRPGFVRLGEEEEWQRLAPALETVRRLFPQVPLSVDTFYASVARRAVRDFGVDIINDISGGDGDCAMFETVAELGVPYVLTYDGPSSAEHESLSSDELLASTARYLAERLERLYALGVADVILDPGFGFGKTLAENYALVGRLGELARTFESSPLLVGFSRKSMIWRLLGTSPEDALTGTVVLNTLALQAGANILRVHDVREAVETVRIWRETRNHLKL